MILMYDSTSPYDIPFSAMGVAGYINGSFPWPAGSWDRFTNAVVKRRISLNASVNDGDTLDVETGAASPGQVGDWVKMRRAAGLADPWVYCAVSNVPVVLTVLRNSGQQASIWAADPRPIGKPPGLPHLLDGTIATQYAWPPESGGHYDLSLVDTATLVTAHEGVEMLSVTDPKSGNIILADAVGEVFVFDRHGQPAAVGYLGGLNSHPEWKSGGADVNGPCVGIGVSDDGDPDLSAYVLITHDAVGVFHAYLFPSSGNLAKGGNA